MEEHLGQFVAVEDHSRERIAHQEVALISVRVAARERNGDGGSLF